MERFLLIIFVSLVILSCSHGHSAEQGGQQDFGLADTAVRDVISREATLGSGDVFDVRVYLEPELSGAYRVASDGTILYPLIGKMYLNGKTPTQIAEEIQSGLSRYIKNPQVYVFVKEFNSRKIFVFGQVQKPGTFPYEDRMTIIQALTLAGGFSQMAAKNRTYIMRYVSGKESRLTVPLEEIISGNLRNFELQPGDIIFVPESIF